MAMLACFESTWTGARGWVYPTLKTHLSSGTAANGSFTFSLTHRKSSIHKLSLLPLPFCLSPLFIYLSHRRSSHAACASSHSTLPPQKCVQVNISRLLMLKGSGSGRYVTGRELSVPRAATDKTEPLSSFHAAFIFEIMDMCDWKTAVGDAFAVFIKIFQRGHPQ